MGAEKAVPSHMAAVRGGKTWMKPHLKTPFSAKD